MSDSARIPEALIKRMVDRFLMWKLPTHFRPDDGISFDPISSRGTQYERRREPTGTNLFDAEQATAMVRHMLDGADLALIRASLAEGDPVPEASVLTRSEPTEADYEDAKRLDLTADLSAVVDLIWQRAQAALPVPAGRKATAEMVLAAIPAWFDTPGRVEARIEAALNAALSLPVPADRSGETTDAPPIGWRVDFIGGGYAVYAEKPTLFPNATPVFYTPPLLSLKGEGK